METKQYNLTEKVKLEIVILAALFIVLAIIFKIIFSKEEMMIIIKITLALYWLFLLPRFALLYYWHEQLDLIERIIIGFALGAAITGTFGYLFGLIGITMKIQQLAIPILCLILAAIVVYRISSQPIREPAAE